MTLHPLDEQKRVAFEAMQKIGRVINARLNCKLSVSWMSISALHDDLFYVYATAKKAFDENHCQVRQISRTRAKEIIKIAEEELKTTIAIFYSDGTSETNERSRWYELKNREFRDLVVELSKDRLVWKFNPPCDLDNTWMAVASKRESK